MKSIDEQELKKVLKNNGLDPSGLDNLNVAEIEELVSSCNSVDEAIQKICEKNPQIDAESLKALLADMQKVIMEHMPGEEEKMSEELTDLEDGDLEAVAGGSIGGWFKKNWPTLVTIAAIGGLCYGGYRLFKASSASGSAAGSTASGTAGAGEGAASSGAAGTAEKAGKEASGASSGMMNMGVGPAMALFALQSIPQTLM